jgi:WD40 repeat protein
MTLNGHTGIITDLAWSPDGAVLASADGNSSLRLWSTKVNPAWLPLPYRFVCEPNWSRDGRSLVVPSGDAWDGTEPPNVEIWDVEKGEPVVGDLNTHHDLYPMAAWLSPDSKNLIFRGLASFTDLSDVEDTHIVDVSTGEVVRTFSSGDENWIRHAAWSPDGSQVATAKINGEIFIWDFATGTLVTRLLHGDGVFIDEVEWSPDGSKLASAGEDTSTWVWDARSWEHLLTLKGHEPPASIWSVSWSPDSRYLLTTSGYDEIGALDTTARIWDGENGEERLVLRGHTRAVIWGTWSPDGSRVATASSDDTTRVWDVATGAELLTLTTPNTFAGYAEWSPDGQNLVVGGFWADAVGVWRVWQSKEELIDYAYECCVFRQLTETERQQFGLPTMRDPQ